MNHPAAIAMGNEPRTLTSSQCSCRAFNARDTFAPHRIARFILIALALIGTVAIARLVLGLLNVHAVTNHFRIH